MGTLAFPESSLLVGTGVAGQFFQGDHTWTYPHFTPGGRLTLESGVPVSSTDQTAKTSLFYTPYVHDGIRLYDGTRIKQYLFPEITLSGPSLTSGKNYDVFLYDNSGTLTLELSQAWSTDTARADALAWQAGLGWVKSGAATRFWLGTIRASATNQMSDAAAFRFVWNAHNQRPRSVLRLDTTDSWTYSTAAYRQAANSSANQIAVVDGNGWSNVSIEAADRVVNSSASFVPFRTAIGLDGTSGPVTGSITGVNNCSNNIGPVTRAAFDGVVGLGYHYLTWLEFGAGSDTQTWYGDAGISGLLMGGIKGWWEC